MSTAQRLSALEVANRARSAKAELRRLVRSGVLTPIQVVTGDVPAHLETAAGAIRVDQLIPDTPGFGAERLRTIEYRTGATTRRVRDLPLGSRAELVAAIADATPSTRKAA